MPAKSKHGPRPKHVPQRLCIACRRSDVKRALIRLVRTPEGHIAVDPTGKQAGRGAYLCATRQCWELALKRQALGRALRVEPSPADRELLQAYAQQLPISSDDDTATAAEAHPSSQAPL